MKRKMHDFHMECSHGFRVEYVVGKLYGLFSPVMRACILTSVLKLKMIIQSIKCMGFQAELGSKMKLTETVIK